MMKIAGVGVCVLSLFVGCGGTAIECDFQGKHESVRHFYCNDGSIAKISSFRIETNDPELIFAITEATKRWRTPIWDENSQNVVDIRFADTKEWLSIVRDNAGLVTGTETKKIKGECVITHQTMVLNPKLKGEWKEHLISVLVHELGHVLGFQHDKDAMTVMRSGGSYICDKPSAVHFEALKEKTLSSQNIAF